MKKKIILNAGHSIADPGAVYNDTTESMESRKIRNYITPLLERHFEVILVPDNLNLVESINWTNQHVADLDDGFAFSIHLNAGGGEGAETYYYKNDSTSKKIAKTVIDKYCEVTGYKNRGAKSDSTTRHGRLGWIRDTDCWSCLIEACFIDNRVETDFLHNNLDIVGRGIYEGICKVFEISPESERDMLIREIKERLNKLSKL